MKRYTVIAYVITTESAEEIAENPQQALKQGQADLWLDVDDVIDYKVVDEDTGEEWFAADLEPAAQST